ncbi:ATP-binding protein [Coleofasciculus sp. FACHB-1120]|uniref:PAS domain-containing sensor histidine kinase n=1 Tax=Coleofasciculus sp. FACHB-1120 TaxID=2692783 RepID=UPI0016833D01|nr:ATP-binding protein [Coleofasciculus sp. FACHB-1120]MBD2740473.1 PAS domain-containing sensor histidine kinase [Coleofasciculus sp. FACHB-1120]
MFLSRDNVPIDASSWVERWKKVQRKLVKRTSQLHHANRELANQITERQQVEEALRQAEEKYRSIFENAVEGIFQTTPDGRYISANPALAKIYGYASPEELIAHLTDIKHQLYVDPNRRDEFLDLLQEHGSVSGFESQVYRKDGSIIWISENARAVRQELRSVKRYEAVSGYSAASAKDKQGFDKQGFDKQCLNILRDRTGALLYCEGFVTDITERKSAEATLKASAVEFKQQANHLQLALCKLQQTQTLLIQNEKMSSLGQLVAGVAHEINNPVNFVCGNLVHANQYSQDLLNLLQLYAKYYPQPVPEIEEEAEAIDLNFLMADFPKTLSSMQIGADRIQQIVQSLRNFSRIDESQMKAVDIHEGIDSTLLILHSRLKSRGVNTGITILKEYGDLPSVECYAGLLNQVFMNLISNAIDALEEAEARRDSAQEMALHSPLLGSSPAPLPCIRIRTDVLDNGKASIRIIDNGPGMSEEIRTKIFDPFFTTKPTGKGTGLGLSISYQIIVERHRGVLKCNSAPEQGTEFVIEIPIRQSIQE